MTNPLVVAPVDATSPLSGAGVLGDGEALVSAIGSGSWVSGGIAAFSFALDAAATVSDPIGSLIAAGLGWLIDHVDPLKTWFDDLTGHADEVRAFAGTWSNVARSLDASGAELGRILADIDPLSGEAMDAYRRFQQDAAKHLQAAGQWAGALSTGLQVAAAIVQAVHDLVRDVLSQLVGSIIAWVAEEAFSLGFATPWVIEQVSTRVAELSEKVGTTLTRLLDSLGKLGELLTKLKNLWDDFAKLVDKVLLRDKKAAVQSAVRTAMGRSAENSASHAEAQGLDDIKSWLGEINPKYTGDPFDKYSNNCGSCAAAVHARLEGDGTAVATANTLSVPEMESVTGRLQRTMSPSEIHDALVAEGPGAHAVIGVDRQTGPGHWFNAYYDGKQVVAIDGQSGRILGWPPDYGVPTSPVVNWDAGIK